MCPHASGHRCFPQEHEQHCIYPGEDLVRIPASPERCICHGHTHSCGVCNGLDGTGIEVARLACESCTRKGALLRCLPQYAQLFCRYQGTHPSILCRPAMMMPCCNHHEHCSCRKSLMSARHVWMILRRFHNQYWHVALSLNQRCPCDDALGLNLWM